MSVEDSRPSVETKPITIRKPVEDLVTERPLFCTICGSSGVTSWSLFWTWTWAVSGLAALVKVSVICAEPVEVEVDVM